VRLIDQPGVNDNLDFVLLTVRLVAQLRREGRTVLIHCVQAQSRTPAVAALYGARLRGIRIGIGIGIDEALADVCGILPNASPIREFRENLRRLHSVSPKDRATSGRKRPASRSAVVSTIRVRSSRDTRDRR